MRPQHPAMLVIEAFLAIFCPDWGIFMQLIRFATVLIIDPVGLDQYHSQLLCSSVAQLVERVTVNH